MSTDSTLSTWRSEIAAEITTLETALPDVARAVRAAETKLQVEQVRLVYLDEHLARLRPPVQQTSPTITVAPAIRERLEGQRDAVRTAAGEVTLVKGQLANLNARLDDLRLALNQLDTMLAPSKVAEKQPVPPVEATVPVIADTIVFPFGRRGESRGADVPDEAA